MENWINKALDTGFSYAAPLNISTLVPRQDVRDMCAADKCGAYGKNWTCPPHCGSLEDCAARIQGYPGESFCRPWVPLKRPLIPKHTAGQKHNIWNNFTGSAMRSARSSGQRRVPDLRQERVSGKMPIPGNSLPLYGRYYYGRFYDWTCSGGCHSCTELRYQHGDHCKPF